MVLEQVMVVATLAVLLQIREGPTPPEEGSAGQGGLETRLAQAEACLVSGQLSAAASYLQQVVQVALLSLLFNHATR